MVSLDDVILSLFPPLTTHMKHAGGPSSSLLSSLSSSSFIDVILRQLLSSHIFPFDALIAVIAVTYCRYTVCYSGETKLERLVWSLVLGYLSLWRFDYWIQIYAHFLSFGVFYHCKLCSYYSTRETSKSLGRINDDSIKTKASSQGTTTSSSSSEDLIEKAQVLIIFGTFLLAIGHLFYSLSYPNGSYSIFQSILYQYITKSFIRNVLKSACGNIRIVVGYLLPVEEFQSAHDILVQFVPPTMLYEKSRHLLFVTFHIQVGMGFLGISFLRNEQSRKNALVKIEDDLKKQAEQQQGQPEDESKQSKLNGNKETNGEARIQSFANKNKDHSSEFRKSAGPFIFYVALPYMIQIVFYGGVNMYAYHCFRDDIHRQIRLNNLFDSSNINGSNRFVSTATSKGSNLSPESYATNADTVITTCYDMINRNLFSLPKLMLLPGIAAKQPVLLLQITPLILLSDWIKSTIVSTITTEVERINKEVKDLTSTRTKLEQYDLKNAELIQRSGRDSILFTERKWMKLTEDIQDRKVQTSLMDRSKMYFSGLQRHFIMMALVDCALAKLIAVGKIVAADIFVYARAIEDMINFVLMKSRSESELATMEASIDVLKELKAIWDKSEDRNLLKCSVPRYDPSSFLSSNNQLTIQNLSYTRGAASVSIDSISINPGIYAVTGANGSGKSTLFRIIMGCDTNAGSVDIHESIKFPSSNDDNGNEENAYSIGMPSPNVVEITQNFYFPLFSAPFDWIYNVDTFDNEFDDATKAIMTTKLEKELKSLNFYPHDEDDKSGTLQSDLTSEKDDWFLDLSGGQKSKVELVRKVFLADNCPDVLLIDETFAPLDPESKQLVMRKLKSFCTNSIVLVIYHADVKQKAKPSDVIDDSHEDSGVENSVLFDDDHDDSHEECVESSNFFDNNLHVENGSLILRPVCAE